MKKLSLFSVKTERVVKTSVLMPFKKWVKQVQCVTSGRLLLSE